MEDEVGIASREIIQKLGLAEISILGNKAGKSLEIFVQHWSDPFGES